MFKEFLDFLKELRDKLADSRLLILGVIFAILFVILIFRLYTLQIVQGEQYQENYIQMTEKTVSNPATRGRIFDCNGNLLADNILTHDVILQDNGDYRTSLEKNYMLLRLVKILNANGEKVKGEFKVRINEAGEYEYSTSSRVLRLGLLRDVYGLKNISQLDDPEGKYPSNISASGLIQREAEYYDIDDMVDEDGNPLVLTNEELLEIINIRYTMSLTAYKKYESITIASNVSEKTQIEVLENAGDMLGVDVVQSTERVYNDSVYFSSILGYTGKVPENQLEALQKDDPKYTLNDIVGRSGVESYMEHELHGIKGSTRMYVDNVGHILEVIDEVPSSAGQDIYLTIDRDLQIGIYTMLEQQLAGILESKIVLADNPNEGITDASQIVIPVKDVYHQLINNNIVSMDEFARPDACEAEKHIYEVFNNYQERVLGTIHDELTGDNPTQLNALPEDINAYMIYIYNRLVQEDIIMPDLIDQTSEYYLRWKADTISIREFLYDGIADNWLDSSVLNVSSAYSDADDIFLALIDKIDELLEDDDDFDKLNYKYLIKRGNVTGRELCMALIAQGAVEYDVEKYNRLSSSGEGYAYEFIMEKISNIEITPAQLALDPCTAGCVVTDVNTGEIKALVSYPGYDNNRLANTMDADYYNSLLNDKSLPLYNNATQAKKAPGSTFKPITAIAAVEEGVVSPYEKITCTGIYDIVDPAIRCWIYPGAHGDLDLVGGIKNSCNSYFNELGHRLSIDDNGNYSTELGIERLTKYCRMFGLDSKSGVEITETEPIISTVNPEQSAMGQGSHSYSNVQLSRYVSAIANKGTVFNLSIIDKTMDSDGNLIKNYTPTIYNNMNITSSTWDFVQMGMREVIANGSAQSIFKDLEVEIAGKTGTAQESKTRGNHAFFISYAPYNNPQVAVTVNIPYGYSSANAATVAKNVYKFYFGYTTLDDIMESGALGVYDVTIGD